MKISCGILVAAALASALRAEQQPEVLELYVYPLARQETVEIHSIIKNLGAAPVTIPTKAYGEGPSWWSDGGNCKSIGFGIGFGEIGRHKLVPSPARFCPVTLGSGESTELPVVIHKRYGEKSVRVTFVVDLEYARRHGWWSGTIRKQVVIGEGENPYIETLSPEKGEITVPNQVPEPTSGSVTPRADARVAPPPPVAHR